MMSQSFNSITKHRKITSTVNCATNGDKFMMLVGGKSPPLPLKIQEIFRMENRKKKRGRPPQNSLPEVAGLSAEGAVNLALDKKDCAHARISLETQQANFSETNRQIKAIGNNINQIAIRLHSSGKFLRKIYTGNQTENK